MTQPPGYKDLKRPDWVCKVNQSLYGVKQSPRHWNTEIHKVLIILKHPQSQRNPNLYHRLVTKKLIGMIYNHFDDIVIVGEYAFVNPIISSIGSHFKISSNEEFHHFFHLTSSVIFSVARLSYVRVAISTNWVLDSFLTDTDQSRLQLTHPSKIFFLGNLLKNPLPPISQPSLVHGYGRHNALGPIFFCCKTPPPVSPWPVLCSLELFSTSSELPVKHCRISDDSWWQHHYIRILQLWLGWKSTWQKFHH